jgi:hypothetical protein
MKLGSSLSKESLLEIAMMGLVCFLVSLGCILLVSTVQTIGLWFVLFSFVDICILGFLTSYFTFLYLRKKQKEEFLETFKLMGKVPTPRETLDEVERVIKELELKVAGAKSREADLLIAGGNFNKAREIRIRREKELEKVVSIAVRNGYYERNHC